MDTPRKTQKEISGQYQGNLGYFSKIHLGRTARFLVSFFAISIGLAIIITFHKRGNEKFFSPGPLSTSHASLAHNCASCHDKATLTEGKLVPTKFQEVLSDRFQHGVAFDPIDKNCASCHLDRDKRTYAFHEPNVVQNRSCSVCHQEHRGLGPMKAVASSQCASCHDNPGTMEASAQKGKQLNWDGFERHPHLPQQIVFEMPRPSRGYTQTFAAFWDGHPEFQLKREARRDQDVLKFNHQRHFAPDIPSLNGRKLECSYCHQPDTEGRYNNQRITFVAQCQACHSLQFDPSNPDLMLPHGDTTAVRAFLRHLETHYADLAAKRGLRQPNEIKNFVTRQMLQLRTRVLSGENFEHEVFFVADPYKPQPGSEPRERASFYGCALCHEVQPVADAAPFIAKPVFVDRWMPQAKFDHTKHKSVQCNDCHHAIQSRLTSDVLMPGIASCVTCHSPTGKVVAECSTCHSYHAPASFVLSEMPLRGRLPSK
jgi:hypothetical protein